MVPGGAGKGLEAGNLGVGSRIGFDHHQFAPLGEHHQLAPTLMSDP